MIASPADFEGTPWAPRWIAPRLGEHTRDVLREMGKDDAEIATLEKAGAVVAEVVDDG
jgi:crotonobetainyl-CoA:carnitine CoA-transferase CaiB-like acyl-CoA transferase